MSISYTVYHRRPLWAGTMHAPSPTPTDLDWPAAYIPVAQVEAQDPLDDQPEVALEEVYRLTQHLDSKWWNNPGMTARKRGTLFRRFRRIHARSTSIGDVVSDGQTLWAVESLGFGKLDARSVTNMSLLEARVRPQTIQLSISARVSEITVWVGNPTHPLTAPVTKPIMQSGGLHSSLDKALEAAYAEIIAALIAQEANL